MLAKLSKEQIKVMSVVRDYWINKSWQYVDLKYQDLEAHYEWLYSLINLPKPFIVVLDSLTELQIAANLWGDLGSQVRSQVGSQVWSQVWSQVRSQVESQVWLPVWSQVEPQKNLTFYNCWESQLSSDSGWVAFYDYFTRINLINFEPFHKYKKLLESGVWTSILLNNIVFVCAPPVKVSRRPDGIVHNPNGAAYEFKNGEKYYVLNGTSIPPKYFETNYTFQDILKEPNVEIRSELIRREGIIKFINHLPSKLLDREGTYELYSIDLTDAHKNTKWLKMKNPSVDGLWHLEAVSRECNKVTDALHDRKPTALKNLPVRLDGENWYQQGDVCIWPDGAVAVKPLPKILT